MATGLPATDDQNPRMHFDIYAILEGSQELYLGHEVQVNINLVEVVELSTIDGKSIKKCYISPTKRRGVERRSLIWSPVKTGTLLGDKLQCGIPDTCAKPLCPICSTYGGLVTQDKGDRKRATLIGRVTHSGGVAVQALDPVDKQRAMHPAKLSNQGEENPIPFKRQYNQPGLLYPVYNHALSITEKEFAAVAYAFLDSLARIGSGNPKGVSLAEDSDNKPLLVFDRYLIPRGKRPIISPSVTNAADAIADFQRLAHTPTANTDHISEPLFDRWIGDLALEKLQEYAGDFVNRVLQAS